MSILGQFEYRLEDGFLFVRPTLKLLGPWDAQGGLPPEFQEFRDALWALLDFHPDPLLLDLSAYDHVKNFGTWWIPLARRCAVAGRPFVTWGSPELAALCSITKLDSLFAIRTSYDESVSFLREEGRSDRAAAQHL